VEDEHIVFTRLVLYTHCNPNFDLADCIHKTHICTCRAKIVSPVSLLLSGETGIINVIPTS
jgi:hypothetical protein